MTVMPEGLELGEAGSKISHSQAMAGIQEEDGKAGEVECLLQERRKHQPERHSKKRIYKI